MELEECIPSVTNDQMYGWGSRGIKSLFSPAEEVGHSQTHPPLTKESSLIMTPRTIKSPGYAIHNHMHAQFGLLRSTDTTVLLLLLTPRTQVSTGTNIGPLRNGALYIAIPDRRWHQGSPHDEAWAAPSLAFLAHTPHSTQDSRPEQG